MVRGLRGTGVRCQKDGENAGQGASIYANEHEQSGIGAGEAGQLRRGRADPSTDVGVEGDGTGQEASIYADEHEQSGIHLERARPKFKGCQFDG